MSKNWAKGSDRQWRSRRAEVLLANQLKNKGMCQLAIPGTCTGLADTVHHTHGRGVTGDNPRFLVAVCTACNLKIGDPTKGPDPVSNPRTHLN